VKLLIDTDQLLRVKQALGALISQHGITETGFGYYQNDAYTGPRCRRCNRLLHNHLWQLVDDSDEVCDVIDCEATA